MGASGSIMVFASKDMDVGPPRSLPRTEALVLPRVPVTPSVQVPEGGRLLERERGRLEGGRLDPSPGRRYDYRRHS